QNKKQKETQKMLDALKKGDKIITIGGIHGVISSVKEKSVIVKVDDDAKIEFNRSAISTVLKSDAEIAKEAEEKAAKEAEKKAKKAKKSEEVVETSKEENKDSE
ncbi:MAG: preprotein translocase subunit YajC, partial [Clostridia bacterium]|nr:preprotein translocase subunit YajC [Clostridia bacterium]